MFAFEMALLLSKTKVALHRCSLSNLQSKYVCKYSLRNFIALKVIITTMRLHNSSKIWDKKLLSIEFIFATKYVFTIYVYVVSLLRSYIQKLTKVGMTKHRLP